MPVIIKGGTLKLSEAPMNQEPNKVKSENVQSPKQWMRSRRIFLKLAGAAALLISLPSFLKAYFVSKLGVRTVEKDNFYFKDGQVFSKKENSSKPYSLAIGGLVSNRTQLSYAALLQLPRTVQTSDFHCVEGWSVKDLAWGGIRFEEIIKIARPLPEAKFALFHALGDTLSAPHGQTHYIECLPISYLLDPKNECLLVLTMDGQPLAHDHGAPMRVIAPFSLAYKSIKFVCGIDFVKEEKPGWWTLANPIYPVKAPVPSSRLRTK
jgi:DMSO/TMAO reductase YedYZ molybdopterin-dependent catalytic subunit